MHCVHKQEKKQEEQKALIAKMLRCQNEMSQILPRLYLSNRTMANDVYELKKAGITHILNVSDVPDTVPKFVQGYQQINIPDLPSEPIGLYFKGSADFISNALQVNEANKVLVHCAAGISRSATIVISYLVQKQNMTLQNALQLVREKRPCICPNPGFLKQLKTSFGNKGHPWTTFVIVLILVCFATIFLRMKL